MVRERLWWFYKHWRQFKITSWIVSGLWTLHMFWWGATRHIPGQSAWDTADAACDHALRAGGMIWLGLWGCWLGAGLSAIAGAHAESEPWGNRVRAVVLAFTSGGAIIGCAGGLVADTIWTIGYAAPIKTW